MAYEGMAVLYTATNFGSRGQLERPFGFRGIHRYGWWATVSFLRAREVKDG